MGEAAKNPAGLFDISGKSAVVVGASGAFGSTASLALGAMGAKMTLASGNEK